VEFLRIIGVNEGIANIDAEGLEHHMHPETLQKLEEFVKSTKK
jgi:Mn-dependent DtxR family transcriptional regulator